MQTIIRKLRRPLIVTALLVSGLSFGVRAQTPIQDSVNATDQPIPPPPPPRDPQTPLPPPPRPGDRAERGDRPDNRGIAGREGRPDRGGRDRSAPGWQAVSTFTGTISRMTTNDDYVYDGFTFKTGSDSFHVHFPPHVGQAIGKATKSGGTASVKGVTTTGPDGQKEIDMVSLAISGTTIDLQPPTTQMAPASPRYVKGSGKITGVATDREGRINTLIVDNASLLRLPPGSFDPAHPLPAVGTTVAYTGTERPTAGGELVEGNRKWIRLQTITLGGQEYLVGGR